ncbi:MAG: hypothetical protein RR420_01200 [Anaerovoracaceae bacterium]
MKNDDKKQEKPSIFNSLVSKYKNDFAEEALSKGGSIAGTLYGMKKGMSLGKAATTTGLAASTLGTAIGATTVPNVRLKRMFNKEVGEDPSKKDYLLNNAVNVIPSAVGAGLMYQNKDSLAKGMDNTIKKAKQFRAAKSDPVARKQLIDSGVSAVKSAPKAALRGAKSLAKNPKLAIGLGALSALEATNMMITPEKLVAKRKAQKEKEMNKSAFEVVESVYELMERYGINK